MGLVFASAIVLFILAVGVMIVGAGGGFAGARRARPEAPSGPTLRYPIPDGQDPASLTAALRSHDYDCTIEETGTDRVLVVAQRDVVGDRAMVRSLLINAGTAVEETDAAPGDTRVRFEDEAG